MILRLTSKTAILVGGTAPEWELLEKPVRAGRGTMGAWADDERLRQLGRGARGRAEGADPTRS